MAYAIPSQDWYYVIFDFVTFRDKSICEQPFKGLSKVLLLRSDIYDQNVTIFVIFDSLLQNLLKNSYFSKYNIKNLNIDKPGSKKKLMTFAL